MSKKRLGLKKIEVPEEIAKKSQALEGVEKIAGKLKMNRTQVKSVLKELVVTPELFNLVLKQAGESPSTAEESSGTPELRVTRTISKNLVKEGEKLWLLDKTNPKTPVKQTKGQESKAIQEIPFKEAEFPEEDEDEDEYDPGKDVNANSDEEGSQPSEVNG